MVGSSLLGQSARSWGRSSTGRPGSPAPHLPSHRNAARRAPGQSSAAVLNLQEERETLKKPTIPGIKMPSKTALALLASLAVAACLGGAAAQGCVPGGDNTQETEFYWDTEAPTIEWTGITGKIYVEAQVTSLGASVFVAGRGLPPDQRACCHRGHAAPHRRRFRPQDNSKFAAKIYANGNQVYDSGSVEGCMQPYSMSAAILVGAGLNCPTDTKWSMVLDNQNWIKGIKIKYELQVTAKCEPNARHL